ncbi:MAG: hypothetical protein KKF24_07030 [Gammaproteobacteria bacterium]|nr:hypothetical protein [Gammaproteobacteria bacterium]MBU1832435.1 hypothetical protein [Gammaproteobacteria bacterium]
MSILTKETARSLATVLNNKLSTNYHNDLVAVLGTGHESSNERAIQSWLMARFAHTSFVHTNTLMDDAYEALTQHLNDLRMKVAIGARSELPLECAFAPLKVLTDHDLQCIARAIYLLTVSEASRNYIDALIELVLQVDGGIIDMITAWVSSQTNSYTYFPSELTLPLAQRFMQMLKDVSESH